MALEYELINPCDPYTFIAEDREVAALVVGFLSVMYGAEVRGCNEENRVPVFFDFNAYKSWYLETFGRNVMDGFNTRLEDLGEAFRSFVLGNFNDRKRYEAALEAIDNPEKREKFIADWQDGRTSLNDIGTIARNLGKSIMEVGYE